MAEMVTFDSGTKQAHMVVEGCPITLSFSEDYNPTLAPLVKETLIDAFLRKNGIGEEMPQKENKR